MYTSFTDWESGLNLAHSGYSGGGVIGFGSWENEWNDRQGDCLAHHGIKGMHWGERRFQNEDGSLTAAGRDRYGVASGGNKRMARLYKRQAKKLKSCRPEPTLGLSEPGWRNTTAELQKQQELLLEQRVSRQAEHGPEDD